MKKNIVFGVYQFLGFHICNYLLESGYEVVGSDWLESESENVEEKKQAFGRNANFSSHSGEWLENDKITMYICLYDYLDNPSFSLKQLEELLACIDCIVEKCNHDGMQMVVFLPEHLDSSMKHSIDEWKLQSGRESMIRSIHLSELYGPWIPSYKFIQKIVKQEISVLKANMSKYIYIDDFFQNWKNIMTLRSKDIYVFGKQPNDWHLQLPQLLVDENEDELERNSIVANLYIEAKTSLREGLQLVKEHNDKLEVLRNWQD